MASTPTLKIEVAYALNERQYLVSCELPAGATAVDAVYHSGLLARFPGLAGRACRLGIFGRPIAADAPLRSGDRVEIYRPLRADPKHARRERARHGPQR
ncbi:MAG: RnfH family protein [Gammaproteobacteria bacterium]